MKCSKTIKMLIFEKSKHFINVMCRRQGRARTRESNLKTNICMYSRKQTPAYSGIIIKI